MNTRHKRLKKKLKLVKNMSQTSETEKKTCKKVTNQRKKDKTLYIKS